ncbi:MAG: hypothetical protein AVDCRST_MAG49-2865, partial [uncultured Thermomicrobiales bacterium]
GRHRSVTRPPPDGRPGEARGRRQRPPCAPRCRRRGGGPPGWPSQGAAGGGAGHRDGSGVGRAVGPDHRELLSVARRALRRHPRPDHPSLSDGDEASAPGPPARRRPTARGRRAGEAAQRGLRHALAAGTPASVRSLDPSPGGPGPDHGALRERDGWRVGHRRPLHGSPPGTDRGRAARAAPLRSERPGQPGGRLRRDHRLLRRGAPALLPRPLPDRRRLL